jgi:hypothetical protein
MRYGYVQAKLTELANLITGANDAMMEAGLPNTLNLWAVYSAVTSHISDCSFFESALSKADWSREELNRIGYKYGLFDTTQLKKTANKCSCIKYSEECTGPGFLLVCFQVIGIAIAALLINVLNGQKAVIMT